jgi:hypothetical protein
MLELLQVKIEKGSGIYEDVVRVKYSALVDMFSDFKAEIKVLKSERKALREEIQSLKASRAAERKAAALREDEYLSMLASLEQEIDKANKKASRFLAADLQRKVAVKRREEERTILSKAELMTLLIK